MSDDMCRRNHRAATGLSHGWNASCETLGSAMRLPPNSVGDVHASVAARWISKQHSRISSPFERSRPPPSRCEARIGRGSRCGTTVQNHPGISPHGYPIPRLRNDAPRFTPRICDTPVFPRRDTPCLTGRDRSPHVGVSRKPHGAVVEPHERHGRGPLAPSTLALPSASVAQRVARWWRPSSVDLSRPRESQGAFRPSCARTRP